MTDLRLALDFPDHPKTELLRRRIGDVGVVALLRVWCFCALRRTTGDLVGMSDEAIEVAARWPADKAGTLVAALVEVGFLDGIPNERRAHDWADHQPYLLGAERRSAHAKALAQRRWAAAVPAALPAAVPIDAQSTAPDPDPDPDPIPSPSDPERRTSYVCPEPPMPASGPAADSPHDDLGWDPGTGAGRRGEQAPSSPLLLPHPPAGAPEAPPAVAPPPPGSDSGPEASEPLAGQPEAFTRVVADAVEVAMVFPCVGRGRQGAAKPQEWGLTADKLLEYREAYPELDVISEMRQAKQWLADNPSRRKTYSGMPRFLGAWLSREVDASRAPRAGRQDPADDFEQRSKAFLELVRTQPPVFGGRR